MISHNASVMKHSAVVKALDIALTSCTARFEMLEQITTKIHNAKSSGQSQDFTATMKFKTLWNTRDAKRLSEQIEQIGNAVNLVISLLQIQSTSDVMDALHEHTSLLLRIERDTRSLRQTHVPKAPESVLTTDEASGNWLSQDLEAILLPSRAYSKPVDRRMESDGYNVSEYTLIEDSPGEMALQTVTQPIMTSTMDPVTRAEQALGVTRLQAKACVNVRAAEGGQLSFARHTWIGNIEKVDDWWYNGQTYSSSGWSCTGLFSRQNVVLTFLLSRPITVLTGCQLYARVQGTNERVSVDEGQELDVQELDFNHLWTCMARVAPDKQLQVRLRNLRVSKDVQRNIEILGQRFSCPKTDLAASTEEGVKTLMKIALSARWTPSELCRVAAQCKSLRELQMLSDVYNELHGSRGDPKPVNG